jgi:hypothetical protein
MKKRSIVGGVAVLVFGLVAVAWAAGDWSRARDRADRFRSEYDDLRRLTPMETREIVTAICEAEEAERREVASRAHDRAASNVSSKFNSLENLKSDTLRELESVIGDDNLKDRHPDARSAKDETQRRWETIERMTRSLRGKNHPVVRYMLEQGNAAHADRQRSSSYCTVSEHTMDSGRADCIHASSCTVIELKPDNSRSIKQGKTQAERYSKELNTQEASRKKLTEKDSSFGKCEKYEYRVDCYKLCPEIDAETNEMRSVYASWRTGCS